MIARETDEEFGGAVGVGRFLGAVEHAYEGSDSIRHEIDIVFAGSFAGYANPDPSESWHSAIE